MQQLTKAEEQVMQALWSVGRGMVKEIIEKLPDPKPAYNTVSTIVRILEQKGFVSHKAYGKTHEYFPLISRDEYSAKFLNHFLGSYFGGSFERLVSFFVKKNDINLAEFEEMMKLVQKDLQQDDSEPSNPA
ncbi:BlaI/MecI/CopY family transcriptional regulator [Rhodoflexus caldus]|uniref:BlaI/MecI/CopY family transcriptional regulator n=1 Tax=Rhodoflexus caldus TaxID=2891236 RepID=UPI002029F1F4|nr:BlaI/MecI/CopY family transcriptional regulator [Rhodoflexus caldus]